MKLSGICAAAWIVCALAPGWAAHADDCHPVVDMSQPQYTIGYGSLMEQASKQRTAPDTGANVPVSVTGYERAWNTRGSLTGFSTTYLGVTESAGAAMVAALYRVFDATDIHESDERETFYCRDPVDPGAIRMLDGSGAPPKGQIWIYFNKPDAIFPPDAKFPIVQSYVDIFITGCQQLQERMVGENMDFPTACVTTTAGWSEHWVNDRLYPRRAFIYQPNAGSIDKLLAATVPEQFNAIRIE